MVTNFDDLVHPDFGRPPVHEVAVSVGFDRPHLPLVDLAVLAASERARGYPTITEALPVSVLPEPDTAWEVPGLQPVIALGGSPPVRFVCHSDNGELQLQYQADLVGANWVAAGAEYPRWPAVRERVNHVVESYRTAVGSSPTPVVVEVQYVNVIADADALESPTDVLAGGAGPLSGEFDPEGFSTSSAERIVIDGQFLGRVRKWAGIAVQEQTRQRVLQLNISAKLSGDVLDDLGAALDRAHDVVVSAFVATTTPQWHARWGRTDL